MASAKSSMPASIDQITKNILHQLSSSTFSAPIRHQISFLPPSQALAQELLAGLVLLLEPGKPLTGALLKAFDVATVAAKDFKKEYPMTSKVLKTIVALVILSEVLPIMIDILGFAAMGPVKGTWAANWQAGLKDVPAGSLFSIFQRVGMVGVKAVL